MTVLLHCSEVGDGRTAKDGNTGCRGNDGSISRGHISTLPPPHPTRSLSPTGVGTLAPARLPAVGERTHAAIRGSGNGGGGAACFEVHFPRSQQNNAVPLSTLGVGSRKTQDIDCREIACMLIVAVVRAVAKSIGLRSCTF